VGGGAGARSPHESGARVNPDPARSADETIERLAWLMDRSIQLPGGYSVGLDPIIGLVPGIGDLIGTLVSSAIVVQAHRAGIPRSTLLRMVTNVGIDAVVGAIPFLGDLFDFAFKANTKNLELYRSARTGARDTRRDVGFLVAVLVALGSIVALPVLGIIWLIQRLFG
jgi:hypothetical protein